MSQYAAWDYYYNLHGKAYYWEETGDEAANSLETVDLFFSMTHGQAAPRPAYDGVCGTGDDPADSATRATWSMWNYNSRARSDHMKLGDEAKGLSFFAVYSCETGKWDSSVWTRWSRIFSGGLRMALAFSENAIWCAPYTCPAQFQHGTNLANRLGAGELVNNAWILAFDDNDGFEFDPITIASGSSSANCADRRDHMTFQNFRNYPRLRDSQMTTLCSRHWTNAD